MNRKKNTFLVVSSEFPPGPGGIGQHAASFVEALSKNGNVVVLGNQDYADELEVLKFNALNKEKYSFIPFALRNDIRTPAKRILQSIALVKSMDPEIVFVSGRFPLWIGAILKMRYRRLRVFGFVHGTEITLTGSLLSRLTKIAYSKLDKIFAVSNFTQSLLHQRLDMSKVKVVPNGLDHDFLRSSEKPLKETYNWKGEPKLLTVGNLTSRKGQHRVIKALPAILKKFPHAHYHIVGLPTDQDKILNMAETLGVLQSITIHGRLPSRDDLYKAYNSADLFIMLSENQKNGDLEGFGIAILEANAYGLPAIGATGCGIEDAISKESGILVNGNNENEITQAIDKILNVKGLYSMGARKWAESHDWEKLINTVLP